RNRAVRAADRRLCLSPRAIQTRSLRDCARRFSPYRRAPASGRRSFRESVLRRTLLSGVFFSVLTFVSQAGDLIGETDKPIGQFLEAPVILDLLCHLGRAIGRNALRELFAFQIALEDKIRPSLVVLVSRLILEELAAKRAAAHPIQRPHLIEHLIPLFLKIFER